MFEGKFFTLSFWLLQERLQVSLRSCIFIQWFYFANLFSFFLKWACFTFSLQFGKLYFLGFGKKTEVKGISLISWKLLKSKELISLVNHKDRFKFPSFVNDENKAFMEKFHFWNSLWITYHLLKWNDSKVDFSKAKNTWVLENEFKCSHYCLFLAPETHVLFSCKRLSRHPAQVLN